MAFNSIEFLIYFPIVILAYFVLPKKLKNFWLLVASYFFYMCWNAKYAVLIFASTVITYLSGIIMEKIKRSDKSEEEKIRLKKWTVALSFVTNIGILGYFKYTNFFLGTIGSFFSLVHINLNIPTFDILLPVGISFYTFQALSYTMDVYRDEIYAEKNFFQYALFVSFFPQLVAGPIERSKNLLRQLSVVHKFSFENAREGLLIMLFGYFIKLVIADRAAVFVDTIFADPETYGGLYIVVAIFIFAVQIYCDFYGYSLIAMGAAKFLDIDLMDNFKYPFLRTSIASLWAGWHISLTSWFRDYLYIPLGGNRKGTFRKYINLMIVCITSGLWHGAAMTYVIWGGLNGLFQVIGSITLPVRKKICSFIGVDRESLSHRILLMLGSTTLFCASLMFFRADSTRIALKMYKSIFTVHNPWILFDGSLFGCGLDGKNFRLLIFATLILLIADICKLNNIVIRDIIIRQHILFRWIFITVTIMFILIFGIWGPAYNSAGFIYFQF